MDNKTPPTAAKPAPMPPLPPVPDGNMPGSSGPVAPASPFRRAFNCVTTYLSPPPQDIDTTQPGTEPSAITEATDNTPEVAAEKRSNADDNNEDSAPSPKKPKYSDFTTKKSDDDSVISAEDENTWEKENNQMFALAAQHFEDEQKAAADMKDDGFEIGLGGDTDGMVGTAEPTTTERTFKWVPYRYDDKKKVTVSTLKQVLQAISKPSTGQKRALFERIRDSGHELIRKVENDDEVFEYKVFDDEVASKPRWIMLTGTPVPHFEGIDMELGATDGFYNPTNPEKMNLANNRRNYLTGEGERIVRPEFAARVKKTKSAGTAQDSASADKPPPPPPDRGGPTDEAKKKVGDIRFARPKNFFDLQLTPEFIKKEQVGATNAKAVIEGQGANTDWVPFDKEEMDKWNGFMLANGIVPRAQLESWFWDCWLRGNPVMSKLMAKKCRNGRTIPAAVRLRQLRRFMCFYDVRQDVREEVKKDPLFKVRTLLNELNSNAQKWWRTGKWVSIDEQTLGFKGKHGMKLRITYKNEGDGFQCDAICERGYTFSFYFRHGDAPRVGHADLNLSPTARRVVWLVQRMTNDWTRVFMDNLFNSRKLFTALHREKALAHGVARANGRGVPEEVIIPKEKDQKKVNAMRGLSKAARLVNQPDCPDLLAFSIVDNNSVNFLSTVAETIEWGVKEKQRVWSMTEQELKTMKFLRTNFVNMYNEFMNFVDIADQLRNNYRPDHWMRQRKWWWAFYIWALGVATTNAWKMYEEMYDEEKARIKKNKAKKDLPPKWTHQEFIIELINDLMWPDESAEKVARMKAAAAGDASMGSMSSLRSGKSFASFASSSTAVSLRTKKDVEDCWRKIPRHLLLRRE